MSEENDLDFPEESHVSTRGHWLDLGPSPRHLPTRRSLDLTHLGHQHPHHHHEYRNHRHRHHTHHSPHDKHDLRYGNGYRLPDTYQHHPPPYWHPDSPNGVEDHPFFEEPHHWREAPGIKRTMSEGPFVANRDDVLEKVSREIVLLKAQQQRERSQYTNIVEEINKIQLELQQLPQETNEAHNLREEIALLEEKLVATVGSTEKFQLQDKQTQQRLNELEAVRRHYQPELHTVTQGGMSQDTGVSLEQSEHSSVCSDGSGHQDRRDAYNAPTVRSTGQDSGMFTDHYSSDNASGIRGSSHRKGYGGQRSASVASTETTSDPSAPLESPSLLLPSNRTLPRSVSMEDNSCKSPEEIQDVLKSTLIAHDPHSLRSLHYPDEHHAYHKHKNQHYDHLAYESSSEAGSYPSIVHERLRSGPASEVSSIVSRSTQSTHSSSSSKSTHRIPRPRPPIPSHRTHSGPVWANDYPEPDYQSHSARNRQWLRHSSRKELFRSRSAAHPGLSRPLPIHEYPHLEEESGSDGGHYDHLHHPPVLHRTRSKSCDTPDKHRKFDGKGEPQGWDTIYLLLSLVTSKEQPDEHKLSILERLAASEATCQGMKRSGCINLLLEIIYNWERKEEESHIAVRQKAQSILTRIIDVGGEPDKQDFEKNVLKYLVYLRDHIDSLFELLHYLKLGEEIEEKSLEECKKHCEKKAEYVLKKLNAKSYDKDDYRPALLSLGALQAVAEVLIVNFKLARFYANHPNSVGILHSNSAIALALSILVNLTYGDVQSKTTLCQIPEFFPSLVHEIRRGSETVTANAAQILRNLSWRAPNEVKAVIADHAIANILCEILDRVKKESTIQNITSALWNLSAHSVGMRKSICSSPVAVPFLVQLLDYRGSNPSNNQIIVENAGGILCNLSAVISHDPSQRARLREAGCYRKLCDHLKTQQTTMMVQNACGILLNLSSHCPDDQKAMWQLGVPKQLLRLKDLEHKKIAEYAGKALSNLLQYSQSSMSGSSKSDITPSKPPMPLPKDKPATGSEIDSSTHDVQSKAKVMMSRARSLHTEVVNKPSKKSEEQKTVIFAEVERTRNDTHDLTKKKEKARKLPPKTFQRISSAPGQSQAPNKQTRLPPATIEEVQPVSPSQAALHLATKSDDIDEMVSNAGEDESVIHHNQADLDSDDEDTHLSHFYVNIPVKSSHKKQKSSDLVASNPSRGLDHPRQISEGQHAADFAKRGTKEGSPSHSNGVHSSPKMEASSKPTKEVGKRKILLGFGRSKDRTTDV